MSHKYENWWDYIIFNIIHTSIDNFYIRDKVREMWSVEVKKHSNEKMSAKVRYCLVIEYLNSVNSAQV